MVFRRHFWSNTNVTVFIYHLRALSTYIDAILRFYYYSHASFADLRLKSRYLFFFNFLGINSSRWRGWQIGTECWKRNGWHTWLFRVCEKNRIGRRFCWVRTIFMENPMYFFNFSLHFFNLNGLKIDLIYKFERIFWLFWKLIKRREKWVIANAVTTYSGGFIGKNCPYCLLIMALLGDSDIAALVVVRPPYDTFGIALSCCTFLRICGDRMDKPIFFWH
jgi:hypothetical protein